MRGWVKFGDNKVVERRVGKIVDRFRVVEREELGDNDVRQWEKDGAGQPRDPWVKQLYLPMVNVNTGEILTFVTSSHGGRSCIGALCQAYEYQGAHTGRLPIVALGVRSYKHKQFGEIENPALPVVGWDGDNTAPARPSLREEMDDDIDFAPR
jgi:hypothetical protein